MSIFFIRLLFLVKHLSDNYNVYELFSKKIHAPFSAENRVKCSIKRDEKYSFSPQSLF